MQVIDIIDGDHLEGSKGMPAGRSPPMTPTKGLTSADSANGERPRNSLGSGMPVPDNRPGRLASGRSTSRRLSHSESRLNGGGEGTGASRLDVVRSSHSDSAPQTDGNAPKQDKTFTADLDTVL